VLGHYRAFRGAGVITFELAGIEAEPVVLLAAINHMTELWFTSQNTKNAIKTLTGDTCQFTLKSECS
jgi:hypothetical protein